MGMNNLYRDARIAQIESAAVDARKARISAVREIQAACLHEKVVESQQVCGARRICCTCGIEEMVRYSWWAGMTVDGGYYEFSRPAGLRTVLNSEFVKPGDVVCLRVIVS